MNVSTFTCNQDSKKVSSGRPRQVDFPAGKNLKLRLAQIGQPKFES